jgi:hypothetical protein
VQAGDAKPFALPTPYYFLPRRPPALNSQEYADAVNEIKAIGGATSAVRTEEQTLSAKLWASVGYKENWAGVWNGVARTLTYSKGPLADRVHAHVRAAERLDDGRRADRAGQQVRVPDVAPGHGHPAGGRRPEPGHGRGPELDAAANYPALPVVCRATWRASGRPRRARWRCTSAPTTSW